MFCSAIIPTVGRDTLSKSVYSVLNQKLADDDYEIIVVNDSGQPLPEMDWRQSSKVTIINTQKRERSTARNTGAAIARGEYLYFLDDDDVMLPGAIQAFYDLASSTEAVWLYGNYQSVDNAGNVIEEFHPAIEGNILPYLVAGEGIPFQVSLLKAEDFYKAGCFDPAMNGCEDRDVGRRLALIGSVMKVNHTIAQIRVGEVSSTTTWSKLPALDRWGREKVLQMTGTLCQLMEGSKYNIFLRGRVSRAYLASSVWNFKQKNLLIALSRFIYAVRVANRYVLSGNFWKGLRHSI